MASGQPVAVAISPLLLKSFSKRLRRAGGERARWIEITPEAIANGTLAAAEIGVTGRWVAGTGFSSAISAFSGVRWLHHIGAGLDGVLATDLRRNEVIVTNSAGAYAPAIAEFVLAGMVLMSRRWDRWLDAQEHHRWQSQVARAGVELHGARLAIVGYGAIGRHLAQSAKAMGMQVWATKRTPSIATAEPVDRLLPAEELSVLLEACDYIVVTASLNSSTRNLIGAPEFARMKRGAMLVNIARGPIVDVVALADALKSGRLRAALLDVTVPEPLARDDPLWDVPNLWITPHISGDTQDGYSRAIDLFCSNLRLYLDGHPERMGNVAHLPSHT